MQDFNTIIGVIQMWQNECLFSVIQKRYHIGSGTTQRILSRFEASGLTLKELREIDPHTVEELIYPPEQVRRKDIPLPDFWQVYVLKQLGIANRLNAIYAIEFHSTLLILLICFDIYLTFFWTIGVTEKKRAFIARKYSIALLSTIDGIETPSKE